MTTVRNNRSGSGLLVAVLAIGAWFILAEPLAAQPGGGMTRRGPTGGKGGGKSGPTKGGGDTQVWTDTGSDRCKIVKFEAAKDSADEDLIGHLSVRPLAKKARTLKLIVRKTDDLRIEVGGQSVEMDDLAGLEWKGLIGSVSWGSPGKQPGSDDGDQGKSKKKSKSSAKKDRELRTLTLESLEVEGTIDSIEGDAIILKARPKGDQEWLDAEGKSSNEGQQPDKPGKNGTDPKQEKKAPQRKLKLKIIDDLTKFEGGNAGLLELGDFQVGQGVEAVVICGTKSGLVVVLKAPGMEGKTDEKGRGEEKTPPPDGGRGGTRRGPAKPPKGGGI